jgi:hypothetical protein
MIKFPKVVAAKLTKEEYDLCQEIARECYISRYIRAPSNSELIRFALREFFERYLSNTVAKNRGVKEKTQETRRGAKLQLKNQKVKKESLPWLKFPEY